MIEQMKKSLITKGQESQGAIQYEPYYIKTIDDSIDTVESLCKTLFCV